jgi:hypothetical protein
MDSPSAHEYLACTVALTIWHLVEMLPPDDPWRRLEIVAGDVLHPATGDRWTGGAEQQCDVDHDLIVTSDDLGGTLDGLAGALTDTGPDGPAVGLLVHAAAHGWGGPAAMLAGSRPEFAIDAGTTAIRLLAWRTDALGLAPPALVIDLGWWALHHAGRIASGQPVDTDEMAAIRWAVTMRHRLLP